MRQPSPAKTEKGWRPPVSGHGKGFLDYIALRPPRIVVIELKNDTAPMTAEQLEWYTKWLACRSKIKTLLGKWTVSPEVYLWRPDDFEGIVKLLR